MPESNCLTDNNDKQIAGATANWFGEPLVYDVKFAMSFLYDKNKLLAAFLLAVPFLLFASPAFAEDGLQSSFWIVTVFNKGGLVMWPILISSVLGLAIALERTYSLRRNKIFKDDFLNDIKTLALKGEFERALMRCKNVNLAMSRIVRAGLLRGRFGVLEVERAIEAQGAHEATLLQANLRGLGVIANLTPMLGLLGTVIGMIKAFNMISTAGTGDPGLVAVGISEALITTATGLTVGIPALAAYHFFRGKVEKFVYEMEEQSLQFVEDIQHTLGNVTPNKKETVTSNHEV